MKTKATAIETSLGCRGVLWYLVEVFDYISALYPVVTVSWSLQELFTMSLHITSERRYKLHVVASDKLHIYVRHAVNQWLLA